MKKRYELFDDELHHNCIINGSWRLDGFKVAEYLPFIVGLVMICGISFWDDVKSLPDSVRLVVQFVATGLMLFSLKVQG